MCPEFWEALRQAEEVEEGSFPTPRGTRSSGRGSAGRLHHSPSWQLSPKEPWLPRTRRKAGDSYTGPGREEDLAGTLGEPCRLGPLTPTVQDAPFASLLHHGLVHIRKASFTYVMIPVHMWHGTRACTYVYI